jgi:putative membrane protein
VKHLLVKNYLYILSAAFLAVWIWSWQHAATPANWFLENELVFIFIPVVALLYYKAHLSRRSLTMIVLFMSLHIIGAHYNYGSVPFGLTVGHAFGMYQNVYDKVVHFSFGFLIFYPMYEFLSHVAKIKGFWHYWLAFNSILAWAAIYELLEWTNVINIDPHLGYLYIAGNDPFDTQKDIAIAGLGALFAIAITIAIEMRHRKKTA